MPTYRISEEYTYEIKAADEDEAYEIALQPEGEPSLRVVKLIREIERVSCPACDEGVDARDGHYHPSHDY